jgi:hypothetical protein
MNQKTTKKITKKTSETSNVKDPAGSKTKIYFVLTDIRGIAGKDYKSGTKIAEVKPLIRGLTADEINGAVRIQEVKACEV